MLHEGEPLTSKLYVHLRKSRGDNELIFVPPPFFLSSLYLSVNSTDILLFLDSSGRSVSFASRLLQHQAVGLKEEKARVRAVLAYPGTSNLVTSLSDVRGGADTPASPLIFGNKTFPYKEVEM